MRSFERRTTFTVGNVTVTVLDRTEIQHYEHEHGFVVMARKEPYAVVVEEQEGERKKRTRWTLAGEETLWTYPVR